MDQLAGPNWPEGVFMPSQTVLSAMAAVQAAMHDETVARVRFLNDQTASNQMLWTVARVQSDLAWSALWELGHRSPSGAKGPQTGREWAAQMRRQMQGMCSADGTVDSAEQPPIAATSRG